MYKTCFVNQDSSGFEQSLWVLKGCHLLMYCLISTLGGAIIKHISVRSGLHLLLHVELVETFTPI